MRKEFAQAIEKLGREDDSIVFISGDLGYNALEGVKEVLGSRFLNAGVAEQNMVGVAAGMAYKGFKVFCYSIAPFVVYRCLEQFRNDVCLHNLPVFLVGNGGGYGYGIMGSSHHALEDIACLSGLQNATTWVPAFPDEVDVLLSEIVSAGRPAYLRLGAGKSAPAARKTEGSFRILRSSPSADLTIISLGPTTNNVLDALATRPALAEDVNVLSAFSLPLTLGPEVRQLLQNSSSLLIVEEHISVGGLAQQLGVQLLEAGISPRRFVSRKAEGYPNGLYGSQHYHQQLSGLDAAGLQATIQELLAST